LFLEEARQVLAQVGKAADVARRAQLGELGELKVGFTASAPFNSTICAAIHAFRRAFPAVHLHLREMSSQEVADALEEKTLEVGFMRPLPLVDSLHALELFREPLVAVLNASHPLAMASGEGIRLSALAQEAFVFFPRSYGSGLYAQLLGLAQAAGFSPHFAQEATEAMTIIGLVSAGLGVSVLPASFRSIRMAGVVYLPLLDEAAESAVWLVRRAGPGSAMAEAFTELLLGHR
jgi:DNA-binding transcriptional LysR family regulator